MSNEQKFIKGHPDFLSFSWLKERVKQLDDDSGSGYEAGWYSALDAILKSAEKRVERQKRWNLENTDE